MTWAHQNGAGYAALHGVHLCHNIASSGNYAQAQCGGQAGCQEPTRDCSGCAADAVRNHAFPPRPAGVLRLGVGCERLLGSAASRPAQSYRLTPARWGAIKLACQSPVPCGSGEAVPDGTTVEPLWNHEHLEITSLFARFQRFHAQASHDARVGTYAQTRAYMRETYLGTLELLHNVYVDQLVSGSRAVPERFHLEPGKDGPRSNGGTAPIGNILAGGYAGALAASVDRRADRAASTVQRSRPAQTFGVSRRAGGLELGPIGAASLVGGNGGFVRVSRPASRRVGRAMLEEWPERRGNQPFLAPRPLPVRLTARPSQADRGEAPPMPPFAAEPAPCTFALGRVGIWNGVPAQAPFFGVRSRGSVRQSWIGTNGSGLASRGQTRAAMAGWGSRGFGCGRELRRSADNAGGRAHVN